MLENDLKFLEETFNFDTPDEILNDLIKFQKKWLRKEPNRQNKILSSSKLK